MSAMHAAAEDEAGHIAAALPAAARAQLHSLSVRGETVSTQADALAQPAPAQGCAVFIADRQSGGVGRHGRTWASPPNSNLYLSLSRRFARPVAEMSGLSLAVGVALVEALHAAGYPQVRLKWPNDLWVDGRKLAGILIQLRAQADACEAVIGLGLNLRMPAEAAAAIDQPWCDLSQLDGSGLSRNEAAARVLTRLLPALAEFEAQGLAPFLPRWQAFDALRDRPVRVFDGGRRHEGLCLGIDDTGALRVQDATGERRFHGGEASLRPA
jgi:BirA family biotin operon repressor/biotin-[acetyl-CoA-carboxylase] ligase